MNNSIIPDFNFTSSPSFTVENDNRNGSSLSSIENLIGFKLLVTMMIIIFIFLCCCWGLCCCYLRYQQYKKVYAEQMNHEETVKNGLKTYTTSLSKKSSTSKTVDRTLSATDSLAIAVEVEVDNKFESCETNQYVIEDIFDVYSGMSREGSHTANSYEPTKNASLNASMFVPPVKVKSYPHYPRPQFLQVESASQSAQGSPIATVDQLKVRVIRSNSPLPSTGVITPTH